MRKREKIEGKRIEKKGRKGYKGGRERERGERRLN